MSDLLKKLQDQYPSVTTLNLEHVAEVIESLPVTFAIVPGGAGWFVETAITLIKHYGGNPVTLNRALNFVFAGDYRSNRPLAEFGDASLSLPVPGLSAALSATVQDTTFAGWTSQLLGAEVTSINSGLLTSNYGGLSGSPVAHGAGDYLLGEPAMRVEDFLKAVDLGYKSPGEVADGCILFGGEIGLGNTVSTALILYSILSHEGLLPEGAGIEYVMTSGATPDPAHANKRVEIIRHFLPNIDETLRGMHPVEALRQFGGLEMASLVGFYLKVPHHSPLIIGGVISTVCALIAGYIDPSIKDHMIASVLSTQAMHTKMLDLLGLRPILSGIGTGEGAPETLILPYLMIAANMANQHMGHDGVANGLLSPLNSNHQLLTMGGLMQITADYQA